VPVQAIEPTIIHALANPSAAAAVRLVIMQRLSPIRGDKRSTGSQNLLMILPIRGKHQQGETIAALL
jgi:hypothetical protein